MNHPQSLPCPDTSEFWPPYIDYPELLKRGGLGSAVKVLRTSISSREAREGMRCLLRELGPFDAVNFHNIMHHITPSVIAPIREANIPIFWTLHDFSLLCPNTNFIDNNSGKLCTVCLKGGLRFFNAPIKRCKKGSFTASAMAAIESWAHRLGGVHKKIDGFISPSRFLAGKFAEAGFDKEKFAIIPNFVELPEMTHDGSIGNYALYFGRLSQEKGVELLLAAWESMPRDAILKVAGTGPLESKLREEFDRPNIEFLGFVEPNELVKVVAGARFTVAPSICWENFPLSVQESFAMGVPVLGANIGGIPEMVIPGETGELFAPGQVDSLAEKALYLWNSPQNCAAMGMKARKFAEEKFHPKEYADRLIEMLSGEVLGEEKK